MFRRIKTVISHIWFSQLIHFAVYESLFTTTRKLCKNTFLIGNELHYMYALLLCMECEIPQILIKNCVFFFPILDIRNNVGCIKYKKKSEMKQRRDSCKTNQSTHLYCMYFQYCLYTSIYTASRFRPVCLWVHTVMTTWY